MNVKKFSVIRVHNAAARITVTVLACSTLIASLVPSPVSAGSNDLIIEGTMQCTDIINYSVSPFRTQHSDYNVQVIVPDNSPTQAALADIKANLIDIAAAARGLNPSTDDPSGLLNDILMGREVIAMIVNPSTGFSGITYSQIEGIYEGTFNNWGELGGQTLIPRARNLESGLHQTFCSNSWFANVNGTLEDQVIAATGLPRLNSDADMINAIASNPNQIGYVGLGSVLTNNRVKVLSLSLSSNPPEYWTPTLKNIYAGNYPQGRGLHLWYLKSDPDAKQCVNDYLTFILSKAGQDSVEAAGGIRARPLQDINTDGRINIGDVVAIGLKWGYAGTRGWIKEDINNDGHINIGDVVSVGLWWGYSYTTYGI